MSTKYILHGGYVDKAEDEGKSFCEEMIKGFDKKPVVILDCMFAREENYWQDSFGRDQIFFSKYIKDFKLVLASPDNFIEQAKEADVIYFKGGLTQMLFSFLNKDTEWLNHLEGKTLAGSSAGAQVISKYYHVLDTEQLGEGFGLVPVKIIVHWNSDYKSLKNRDIDWDYIYEELKDYKEDLEIITLKEGEFKVFEK